MFSTLLRLRLHSNGRRLWDRLLRGRRGGPGSLRSDDTINALSDAFHFSFLCATPCIMLCLCLDGSSSSPGGRCRDQFVTCNGCEALESVFVFTLNESGKTGKRAMSLAQVYIPRAFFIDWLIRIASHTTHIFSRQAVYHFISYTEY